MAEIHEVKLKPEESGRDALNEDLISPSNASENYLSGGYEPVSTIKNETISLSSDAESDLSTFPVKYPCSDVEERSVEGRVESVRGGDKPESETLNVSCSSTQLMNEEKLPSEGEPGTSQNSGSAAAEINECPLCKKNFSCFYTLKQHIERKHVNEKEHVCIECGKLFNLKSDLNRHIKHVHKEKIFRCEKCVFSSSYKHVLKLHVSAVHLEEKPHKCPQCESCFSYKGHLTQHIRSVHNHEKPFTCDQCDLRFSAKGNLAKHQRAVHEGVKDFQCSECEYKSSTNGTMQRHLLTVHHQVKLYSCNECDKTFAQISGLHKHINSIHKGLKPYACTECDSKFSGKQDLQRHVDVVHLKQKLFSCFLCSRSCSSKKDLRRHVDAVHHGYKPYECQQCCKTFAQKHHLNKHMTSIHKIDQSVDD